MVILDTGTQFGDGRVFKPSVGLASIRLAPRLVREQCAATWTQEPRDRLDELRMVSSGDGRESHVAAEHEVKADAPGAGAFRACRMMLVTERNLRHRYARARLVPVVPVPQDVGAEQRAELVWLRVKQLRGIRTALMQNVGEHHLPSAETSGK